MNLRLDSCMEGAEDDELAVWTPVDEFVAAQGVLFLNVKEEQMGVTYDCGVHLDRERITKLRDALTIWLGEDN